ncbi:TBC domain-containing protein [Cyclospora cayetanensis]|uniref:TBC domain-containing protein n=1 Tax=Cyclospora cayetanensis TaxID=88456 RepID=A0A1D3CUQ2_9EIME|nr:TBC domain-containing protein [Cyclospora cayetanensis]
MSLQRILIGCASRDGGVGYCQGMNYLGALFLYVLQDEFDAYRCLVSLLKHRGLRCLYTKDLMPIKALVFAFERIMEAFLPQLHAKLAALCIPGEAYLLQWLLPAFAVDFPLPLALRMLDILILKGQPLLSMGPDEALHYIRGAAAAAPFADLAEQRPQLQALHTAAADAGAVQAYSDRKTQQQLKEAPRHQQAKQQQLQKLWHPKKPPPGFSTFREIEMQPQQQRLQSAAKAEAAVPRCGSSLTPGEAWLLHHMHRFRVSNKMIEALEKAFAKNRNCRLCIQSRTLGSKQWRIVFVVAAGEMGAGTPKRPNGEAQPPPVHLHIISNYFAPSEDWPPSKEDSSRY